MKIDVQGGKRNSLFGGYQRNVLCLYGVHTDRMQSKEHHPPISAQKSESEYSQAWILSTAYSLTEIMSRPTDRLVKITAVLRCDLE